MTEKLEKVPLIPGPGAILQENGTWLEPQADGGYLFRQRKGVAKGPTPAELRKRMRGDLATGLHIAAAMLADEGERDPDPDAKKKWIRQPPSGRDKLAALEFLAKYGVGQRKESFSPELVRALAMAVQAEVKDRQILARVEARWAQVLKEHLTGDIQDE